MFCDITRSNIVVNLLLRILLKIAGSRKEEVDNEWKSWKKRKKGEK